MRPLRKRIGATCIEVLWLLLILLGGLIVACYAGAKFGWLGFVVGLLAGTLASCGVYVGSILMRCLLIGLSTGIPEFPPCGNGKCKYAWTPPFGDYQLSEMVGDRIGVRCQCGSLYVKQGRRMFEVLPDGTRKPHMIWKPFRGWYPDGEASP